MGIVVALVGVSSYMLYGATQTAEPAPEVTFEMEPADGGVEYELVHTNGETLDGDRLELRGAADAETAAGTRLAAGDSVSFYPTSEEVSVVWYSEGEQSYVLTTGDVSNPLPDPDEGCEWVDDQTNGGADPITIDNMVVNCDVETSEQVTVRNGAVVIGEAVSDSKELDGDEAFIYGPVDVENVLNHQDGTIAGDATSRTADVKIQNGSVDGAIDAQKVAEVTDGTTVAGDMESQTKDAKVLDSIVEGSVTADDTVKLQGAEVEGEVYADPADFDCTDSTINGQDCGTYSPKDPSNW